jgi:hypothetical protein
MTRTALILHDAAWIGAGRRAGGLRSNAVALPIAISVRAKLRAN